MPTAYKLKSNTVLALPNVAGANGLSLLDFTAAGLNMAAKPTANADAACINFLRDMDIINLRLKIGS